MNENRTPRGTATLAAFATLALLLLGLAMPAEAANTIHVSATPNSPTANGTALRNAVNGINGNAWGNRFVVKLEPGVYDVGTEPLQMKEWVDIEGEGRGITLVKGTSTATLPTHGILNGADNAELRSLTVQATGTDYVMAVYTTADVSLRDVYLVSTGGLLCWGLNSRGGDVSVEERRHGEHEAGEAVVEVAAETAVVEPRRDVDVGRRQHPHVDPDRCLAERLDLLLLEGAQQLRLQTGRHLADLVEEEGAAVGAGEPATARSHPGRHPLADAEQLRFEQRLRNGSTIDRDERLPRTRRGEVQCAGQQLLADPGLADDQHRQVAGGERLHLGVETPGRSRDPRQVTVREDQAPALLAPALDEVEGAVEQRLPVGRAGHRQVGERADEAPVVRSPGALADLDRATVAGSRLFHAPGSHGEAAELRLQRHLEPPAPGTHGTQRRLGVVAPPPGLFGPVLLVADEPDGADRDADRALAVVARQRRPKSLLETPLGDAAGQVLVAGGEVDPPVGQRF